MNDIINLLNNIKNNDNIFKNAIKVFGSDIQKEIFIEEMAELIQALQKEKRGRKHNINEELSDVLIMVLQMSLLYDINKDYQYKISRLEQLLSNYDKNTTTVKS